MASIINAWADFVIARRLYLIAATVLALPLILFTGGTIPTDNSSQRFFIEGDPALADFDNLIELFGDNEFLIVGFEATNTTDIFNADTLRDLARVSDFLEFHEHVTQLRSLTNFQYIHADGDDLSIDYLIDDTDELIDNQFAIETIKAVLEQEDLALDNLITRDYRHTRIIARVEHRYDTSEHKVQLAQDLYRFIDEEEILSDQYQLHLSGYVLAQERLETVVAEDTSLLIPVMIVLMLCILFASFRSVVATIYPWLVIVIGLLIVLEIQYYLGIPHTSIDSSALGPMLIIIGIGLTVHVLVEFFHSMRSGMQGKEAAHATIIQIWQPAFFTAITTSAGFYALSITKLVPIREFALLGTIGPLLLFFFSLSVLPAMLSYSKKFSGKTYSVLDSGFISKTTRKVPAFTLKHRNLILALGVVTLLLSIWNIPSIRIDTNYINLFKENSTTRQDIYYFDDTYRGMMTLDIVVDSGEIDGIKNPQFLSKLEELQSWLNQRNNLGPINSLVDYMKEINQALNGDDPAYARMPDSREMAAQFLLLYDSSGANEDLSDINDFDLRYTRLMVPVINMPALEMRQELASIRSYLENNVAEYDSTITGTMVLKTQQDIYVVEGMAKSFFIALAVITIFFIALFKSLKYGLLSIIPSVLPIMLAASFAGLLGIDLDLSAVIVFAMTLGIAVDDSIHVMSRYLLAKRSGASTQASIQRAMNESGRAVVFSTLVLVSGFSVLCFASITTVLYVGLFSAVIMSLALIGDLIFLPAILYLVDGSDGEETTSAENS